MKKTVCTILLCLTLVICLTACNFTTNVSGKLAGEVEASQNVETMMIALAQKNTANAKNMIHPNYVDNSEDAIVQISTYLSGREVVSVQQLSIDVKTSTGLSGKARQETVTYTATLTDGEVIYLNVVHLSDNAGEGFTSFQLVLGLI